MKNTSLVLALATVMFVCYNFQCNKEIEPEYSLEMPMQVTNEKPVYKVGDIIWLELKTPDGKLLDTWTGQRILLDNPSVPFVVEVAEQAQQLPIDTNTISFVVANPAGSDAFFNYTDKHYSYLTGLFGCGQDTIGLRVGIQLKKAGTYSMVCQNAANSSAFVQFGPDFDCAQSYGESLYAQSSYIFDMADVRKDLYDALPAQSNIASAILDVNMETLLFSKRAFWFKVED